MLTIENEETIRLINSFAAQEYRPAETVVRAMVMHYLNVPPEVSVEEHLRRLHARFYQDARHYWEESGDMERLKLSEEEVAEKLAHFAADGRPVLKGDPGWDAEPEPGTLAYLAKIIREREAKEEAIEKIDTDPDYLRDYGEYTVARYEKRLRDSYGT